MPRLGFETTILAFERAKTVHALRPRGGRAVAQAVSRWLPTRAGFACGQHVRFVVNKAALEQIFSEYFGFPCQSFHQILHHHNHPGLAE
jgi:hypothetical protein